MSLLFLDSFDHYSTAQLTRKWNQTGAAAIVSNGRTGKGIQSRGDDMRFSLEEGQTEISVGMAFRLVSPKTGLRKRILRLENNGPFEFTVSLFLMEDQRFCITFSGSAMGVGHDPLWPPSYPNVRVGNEIWSMPSALSINEDRWYYLELHATIAVVAGGSGGTNLEFAVDSYLNEDPLISADQAGEVDPLEYPPLLTKFTSVVLEGPGTPGAIFDDVYITDGELLGDIKIGVLYPNAVGAIASMTPNAAGDNYTKVNEHTPDDDTTYVYAAAASLEDLYNLDDIGAFTGTIKGAQTCVLARKSDTGSATVRAEWKSGATKVDGLEMNPSAVDYIYLLDPRRKSLFTAADWTVGEIDGLQIGQQRTA